MFIIKERVLKKSRLDESKAFSINCMEKLLFASTTGTNQECSINFNYALADINPINIHEPLRKLMISY